MAKDKTSKAPTSALSADGGGEVVKKKKKRAAPVNNDKKKGGGIAEYFKGVRIETKKVVWPTRRELFSYTIVVFAACAFFGLMIWGVDSAFLFALKQLLGITF